MKLRNKISLVVFIALIFSTIKPITAYADDVTPPSDLVEENVVENPIVDETVEETTSPDNEPETVLGALEELPEVTEIVIVDENGEALNLVTEEAEQAIETGDPVWCPATLSAPTPGSNGCTSSYTSFQDLLNYLDANEPTEAGVIWIESSYDSSVNDAASSGFEINDGYFATMGNYALTIQGGWSGISGDNTIGTSSVFNGDSLSISWGANITINNIYVQNTSNNGVSIFSTDDIELNNVQSDNNSLHGIQIYGAGSVDVNNTTTQGNTLTGIVVDNRFAGNTEDISIQNSNTSNNNRGIFLISNGDISIDNLTSNGNSDFGAEIYNNESGSTGEISIENSEFSNNSQGATIHSNNNITLNSVISNQNNTFGGVNLVNTYGSGNIFVENSTFSNNLGGYGVSATSYGTITLSNVVANENSSGAGIESYGSSIFVFSSTFNNNTYYGIDAEYSTSDLFLIDVSFDCLNGLGDFIYNGIIYTACDEVPTEEATTPEPISFSLNTLSVNAGEIIELNCENYSGTKLILPNGNLSTFNCPITGSASLNTLESENLPNELPEGTEYVSGLAITQTPDGSDVALNGLVAISFIIPNELIGEELAILYWNGEEWVDLAIATFDDGRSIFNGGYVTPNGYFEALTNFTGNFVLVKK